MKKTLYSIITLTTLFGCKNYNPEITRQELKEDISYLASDSLKGRKPGTSGDSLSALFIKNKFKDAGLELLADNGYQHFDVITRVEAGKKNNFEINGEKAVLNKDFVPLGFSANKNTNAEVVFAGYGFDINNDSLKWNDYDDIAPNGKWVIAFRADPDLDNPMSPYAAYSNDRYKAMTAVDHGAAGLLLVNTVDFDKNDKLDKIKFDQSISSVSIPVIQITRKLADKILAGSGKTVEELEKELSEKMKPESFAVSQKVNATANVSLKKVKTQNVVGMVKGTEKPDEYIVIGGHYDHLGMGGPGSGSRKPDTVAVHNGADDNASGTAGVIELAQKISEKPLDRSVIFVAFSSEELGLVGSKYFVNNPPVDIKNIKAMINMDMIGRLDSLKRLSIGGTGTAEETDSILDLTLKNYDFEVAKNPQGSGPSDHSSFYFADIPVLFITTGVHDQYHTPEDDVDRINFPGEEEVVNLVYDIASIYGNSNQSLTLKKIKSKQPNMSRRRMKVTLGIIPGFTSNVQGLAVDGVRPGGPAENGGMKKGDVIVAIEDQPVTSIYDYMYRLAKFNKGDRIVVEVERNGKKEKLLIEL
ncbi:MAG: M28 family peptidase [Chlorobi bacterium]|nr:M28 family peptidase [Chlorobiota bacterium]